MGHKHCTILMVEDDIISRSLTRFLLKSAGYEVLETDNGLESVELARTQRPALILMDMDIPGLNGYEATARIKAMAETKDIPVVALTAKILPEDRARSFEAGCDGYLSKPVNPHRFIKEIEGFLSAAAQP